MKLIVGLGNPGKKYDKTRHNVGFMVLNAFAKQHNINLSLKSKFKGEIGQTIINDEQVLLLKPSTYMNLSGESVIAVKKFYNLNTEDILIIYDDLDLTTGTIRFRQKGSPGGHNGIKSITNSLNTQSFQRLKIGIDRSQEIPVVHYVLGKFTNEEKKLIEPAIQAGVDAIDDWLSQDIIYVMNKYN